MKCKETITLDYPPDAHYNPAVRAGDFVYTCGHIGLEDESGRELTNIEDQTRATLVDLRKTLAAAGATMDDIVKATVYIADIDYYEKMNEVYMTFFEGPMPARSTIVTRLVMDEILIEIEAVAYKPQA
ncbi:TPA: RidA family protein [Candidatus Bathyarchaeota archaeon]|nr:RidA family protein [Candidatus Bathyarchaeota archaeon]